MWDLLTLDQLNDVGVRWLHNVDSVHLEIHQQKYVKVVR